MAAKGSKSDASDEIFDFVCSPCSKKDRNNEAVNYCADCQEYLCVACVECHNSFSIMTGHTLLGRSQFGTTSKADSKYLPSVPTERCKVHTMKLMDMYCVDHDAVGCHVCFTINHKPCQNIHYIPEYVQATDHTSHIKTIEDELKKAISTISMLLTQTEKTRDENNKRRASSLKDINDFRAEINQTLDRLEQATIAEQDENFNKLDFKFEEEVKKMQETLDNLKKRLTEMESSRKNPSQLFVCSNVCRKNITEAEQNRIDTGNEQKGYRAFVGNPEILRLLQKLSSLGKVKSRVSLYEILDQQSYCVKQKDDNNNCDILASCRLDSGNVLLADYSNKSIKLVDCRTYTVRSALKMSHSPLSVCVVSGTEVAVSLGNNTVQFVSIVNQLTPGRSLKFDHTCRGIAVMGDQLVLSEFGGKNVHIYTMDGTRVKTFSHDTNGYEIFRCTRYISMSYDGKMILVTDGYTGLVTIDTAGNVIWRSGQCLKEAWGVCTDDDCNVFASDTTLKTVVQIGFDGQYIGDIVPLSRGLRNPKAVCFHEISSTLIVTDGNQIHVFRIN